MLIGREEQPMESSNLSDKTAASAISGQNFIFETMVRSQYPIRIRLFFLFPCTNLTRGILFSDIFMLDSDIFMLIKTQETC